LSKAGKRKKKLPKQLLCKVSRCRVQ